MKEPVCMRSANDRRRHIVTSSLIGWVRALKDPCLIDWLLQERRGSSALAMEFRLALTHRYVCSLIYPLNNWVIQLIFTLVGVQGIFVPDVFPQVMVFKIFTLTTYY